jgi:hypothetical protein
MSMAFKNVRNDVAYKKDRPQTMVVKSPTPKTLVKSTTLRIENRQNTSLENDDNQSMIADLADDCETNRDYNDNYRLDMTYAD